MGRGKRTQPKRLKEKLRAIRSRMDMTLAEIAESLKKHAPNEFVDASYISQYEKGKREPSLLILLAYSKLTGVSTDRLIDDEKNLPTIFPIHLPRITEAARLREK